jgi:hypothetical protein
MSFRPRKSVSSNGKMKKMPSVLKCRIHSSIPVFLRFNRVDMPKCGKVLTTLFMALNQQVLQDLAIIMGSLEVPLVVQEGILRVGTPVGDTIIQIVEVKEGVRVMAVDHILLKGGGHLMGLVVCLQELVVVLVVEVALELQIILKVVLHMVDRLLVVGIATNSMAGSSRTFSYHRRVILL